MRSAAAWSHRSPRAAPRGRGSRPWRRGRGRWIRCELARSLQCVGGGSLNSAATSTWEEAAGHLPSPRIGGNRKRKRWLPRAAERGGRVEAPVGGDWRPESSAGSRSKRLIVQGLARSDPIAVVETALRSNASLWWRTTLYAAATCCASLKLRPTPFSCCCTGARG